VTTKGISSHSKTWQIRAVKHYNISPGSDILNIFHEFSYSTVFAVIPSFFCCFNILSVVSIFTSSLNVHSLVLVCAIPNVGMDRITMLLMLLDSIEIPEQKNFLATVVTEAVSL